MDKAAMTQALAGLGALLEEAERIPALDPARGVKLAESLQKIGLLIYNLGHAIELALEEGEAS